MLQAKKSFICGACEGFYGKPWSFSQRQELFKRMKRFNMNTYLYAPKDDYKHRLYWRELYNSDEADELRYLIRCAEEYNISFVYAISPGLDVTYSSLTEINTLKKKLDQVKELGCHNFALLFDDIEDDLSLEDSAKFASIADAQACLTNDIFNHLGQPDLFLFCPTEYCSSRSLPTVKDSPYLKTLGLRLDNRIDFFWTGPKVVSRKITVENIEEVATVMKRPVTIWDNIHANDYDQTRIYLGPFEGRPTQLISHLRGVLTNPNCEFEANFIALHTLAQWSVKTITRFPGEADMEVEEEGGKEHSPPSDYEPRKALEMAIMDWLPELYKAKSSFGQKNIFYADLLSKKTDAKVHLDKGSNDIELEDKSEGGKKFDEDVPMATDEESRVKKTDDVQQGGGGGGIPDVRKKYLDSNLYWQEVQMICDFFYLPFEHGPTGEKMLNAAKWLVDNFHLVFHPFPDSLQQRFTSGGYYQTPNTLPSFPPTNTTLQSTVPLNNTTTSMNAISASNSSSGSPLTDASTSPTSHPQPPTSPKKDDNTSVMTPSQQATKDSMPGFGSYDDDLSYYGGGQSASDWYERAIRFHDGYGDLSAIVDKLVNIPNRELLYELYKHINDIRSNLALVNSYIKWHGIDKRDKDLFKSGEQEPWVHRGGLLAEFRRLLPFESSRSNNVYIVRPYYTKDYYSVSSVCLKTFNDLSDASHWLANPPTLVADCFIGAYLNKSSKYSFVLEDNYGVAGYALAFENVHLQIQTLQGEWLSELKLKYPFDHQKEAVMNNTTAAALSSIGMKDETEKKDEELKKEEESTTVATTTTEMSSEFPKEPPPPPTTNDSNIATETTSLAAAEDESMSAASSSTDHSRSGSLDSLPKSSSAGIMANFSSYGYPSYPTFVKSKIPFSSPQGLLQCVHTDSLHHVTALMSMPSFSSFISKYPSPVSISLSRYKERAAKMLLASAEQALSNSQSCGMHALVPINHKCTIELYCNLGFKEFQTTSEITSKGFVLLFKSLLEPSSHSLETSGVKILGRCEPPPTTIQADKHPTSPLKTPHLDPATLTKGD